MPQNATMKTATVIAPLLAALSAPVLGQVALPTTINRVPTTYFGGVTSGHSLGGFAYQPLSYLAAATPAAYQQPYFSSQTIYQGQSAAGLSSTAVLGASNQQAVGLAAIPAPVAVQSVQHVSAPAYHVNTVHAPTEHVQFVHAAPAVTTHVAAPAVTAHVAAPAVAAPAAVVTPTIVRPAQVAVQNIASHAVLQHTPVTHVAQQTHVVAPPTVEHHGNVQVFRFHPDSHNEIRVVETAEEPRFEQVTIKDPKVAVFNLEKPSHPAMRMYQVVRTPSAPTTVEFVRDGPSETQVTVFDDNNTPHTSVRPGGVDVHQGATVKAVHHPQQVTAHIPTLLSVSQHRVSSPPKSGLSSSAVIH